MDAKEQIKEKLAELLEEGAETLGELAEEKAQADFSFGYQTWYSKALMVVEKLAPDRYEEFRKYYEPDPKRKSLNLETYVIQDFLRGLTLRQEYFPGFEPRKTVTRAMINQLAILKSVIGRIDSILADIMGRLYSELKDAEIETARALIKVSPRAAGSLAGVVIEAYLQKVAQAHQTSIGKKTPTIGNLNEALKKAGVYGIPEWRKMSYLADIRNMCTHRKSTDPSLEQVTELIDGADWLMKNVR